MNHSIITLEGVVKRFGSNVVVKNLNLEVGEGEFLTLLGPSRCGKTTTLRMIAGFEEASEGIIKVEGERVEDKEPFQRNVNTVFQNYALFPHMTVYNNIAYGLTIKKVPKAEIHERVMEMLRMVQMEPYANRKPDALSGGQKQRIAIARALVNNPKVLLLDEPLGALDLKLRKQMQIELKRLQKKLGITFIYVTHDQEEALTMSDRIAIMHDGLLEQLDSPTEIYEHPKTKFVAGFIGESNMQVHGKKEESEEVKGLGTRLHFFIRLKCGLYSFQKRLLHIHNQAKIRGVLGLKTYIEERAVEVAKFMIHTNATVRETAKKFGISKSTVHKDITDRVERIDPELAKSVRQVLEVNKAERHIRGGLATREKYLHHKGK